MFESLGFTVLRQIPLEYLAGIASGQYSVHGGVLRDAAGRILAHLAIPEVGATLSAVPGLNVLGQLLHAYQLQTLSQNVQQVLSVSLVNTALSGLGLATSFAGFAYLARRLTVIEGRIAELKAWLKSASEGQLRAAVADLGHAARAQDTETRRQLMLSAKTIFAGLAHHYRSQAASTRNLDELQIYEDYCVTAMLGAVMCASDLGLKEAACDDMRAFRAEWATMARSQLQRLLDLGNASRLLDGRYANVLPTSDLIAVLDFANADARGLQWIDELRRGYGTSTALTSGLRAISDDTVVYARKIRARDDVLASYEEHFQVLAAKRLSVSEFARLVQQATAEGKFAVLVPNQVPAS